MAISLLLADDSPTIAKILTMALANENYQVRSVLSAAQATEELRINPPEIFLVDLNLPEMDGYALSKFVKKEHKLNNTRVGLLASAFEPADPEKVKECGADMVIVKPFDPTELRSKLKAMLALPPPAPPRPRTQEEITISNLMGSALDEEDQAATNDVDSVLSSLQKNPEPLSTSAQALATFFDAQIESHSSASNHGLEIEEGTFSLDISEDPNTNFSGWSSPQLMTNTPEEPRTPSFDTGNSNFKFADNYIERISMAFDDSRSHTPHIAPAPASPTPAPAVAPAPSPAAPTYGSLSLEETARIEKMIREEVQLVCREIVEKVAWEVIPELAENLIKKELKKVLEQLEN